MAMILAEYDGRAFVPVEPVEVPVGTRVEIVIPPRRPTEEENRQWQDILRKLESSEPRFPTLDEAMQYLRKRP